MRLWIAIALALGGCYRPDVAPCFLTCGTNESCPDGLTCNGQGLCASAANDMCSDMPPSDGGVDEPPPVFTNVMIDVLDSDGSGQNDVRIVFSTPSGGFIKEARTLPNGHVSVPDVPVGSSATIMRLVGTRYVATTYLALWENARIVSRMASPTSQRQLMVTWSAPGAATNYDVNASCMPPFNTNALSVGLNISNSCPTTDVIIIARDANMNRLQIATVDNIGPAVGAVNISSAMWRAFGGDDAISVNLTNVNHESLITLSAAMTRGLGSSGAITQQLATQAGEQGPMFFPTELPARVDLFSTMQTPRYLQQFYVELLPPGTLSYARDMATITLPWIDFTEPFDVATKSIRWPIVTPDSGVVQPSIIYAKLAFTRGGVKQSWTIIGRGEHINTTTTMGTFQLPDIPDDNAFEPTSTDSGFEEEIGYLRVTPGLENEVRGRIESHETGLDIFGITGLTYVTKAWAY